MTDGNVQRKQQAAVAWCQKVNTLAPTDRMNRIWEYVLLSEQNFYLLARNHATLEEMCSLNRVSVAAAGRLFEG